MMLDSLFGDLRFAARTLRKNPGFAAVAVITLALGIGANTAIFSVLDPLVLRKLPVRDPDQLVWVNAAGPLGAADISEAATFELYREKASAFSDVLAFSRLAPYKLTYSGQTSLAKGEFVSGNYFEALGLRPFAGRLFEVADEKRTAGVVLSFDFWKREFGSDPQVVRKFVSFGDQADASRTGTAPVISYSIVGIAPPDFSGLQVGEEPDFYAPLGAADLPTRDYWQANGVTILARLKPGVSMAQAEANVAPLLEQAGKASTIPRIEWQEFFARPVVSSAARGLSEARAKFSLPARILMAVVALVLLIACGNIANLQLARGVARRREFAVRLALGAGKWRLVRQILTESALVAVAGAVAGVLAGVWASKALVVSLSTRQLPIALKTDLNWRLLAFAGALMAVTVILCGIAPALLATRAKLGADLKGQGVGAARASRSSAVSRALIVAQVALAVALLAGGGLLLHSLFNLETFDAGFDRKNVLIVKMSGHAASRTRAEIDAMYAQLLDRVKQLPGVRSASCSSFTPISGTEVGINVTVEGYTLRPGEQANERFTGTCPGYFATMGIPRLAGRDFDDADAHPEPQTPEPTSVTIINRTMARRFFGDASPIGKHLQFAEGRKRPPLEIVGVVADSKYNTLREGPTDFFYIPGTHGDVEIRSSQSAASLAGPLREIVKSLDSSATIESIGTLRAQVDESLHQDRLVAALCSAFSGVALALSCIGLYGVLSFSVARRTAEIGVRMALGARARDILALIVGKGIRLVLFGLLAGSAGAIGASAIVRSLLFGVGAYDPLTFAGVVIALGISAWLACYLPARRAMQVDPTVALRQE